mmetsp:Transcript_12334/g.22892  ORF Transcript_12334/g.22892 Transcript_12334/m.22892 type:complete len:329 (+) Transcript_12334:182-1168(+)
MRSILGLSALLALVLSKGQAEDECEAFEEEEACELNPGCYWAAHLSTPRCDNIPSTDSECVCTLDECPNPNDGPSGCEPRRFCVSSTFNSDGCVLAPEPESDDGCKEDGSSCFCVPSEYCRVIPVLEGRPCTSGFLNEHCIMIQPTSAPSASPTESPATPTLKPSRSPETVVPTTAQVDATQQYIVYGGATTAALLFIICLICFYFSRNKGEPELKGVISPDKYLETARPLVPKAPEIRQELTPEQLEPDTEGMLLKAIYDFEPEHDDELGMKEGDLLIGLFRYPEWWEARNQANEFGIVPSVYVEEVGLTEGVIDADNLEGLEDVDF